MPHSPSICLALDTALEACSVGLAIRDGEQTGHHVRSLDLGRGHAEHLMGELEALLEGAELTYRDLSRLAVTIGPGSFTGLRVGLATARALALALDLPLIGASSLKALELTARSQGHAGPLACLIDARRNQIYGQIFRAIDGITQSQPCALAAEAFAELCKGQSGLTFLGSGAPMVIEQDAELASCSLLETRVPNMASLAEWALDQPVTEEAPAPLYLRPPDAKPQASKAIARK